MTAWKERKTPEEVYKALEAELEEISADCVAEGYTSHGSNYELRAEQARQWWEECYPEYF